MHKIELNELDRKKIKLDIEIFLFISLIFFLGIILFFGIIFGVTYYFYKPTEGFSKRLLSIFICLFLIFFALQWSNLLKLIDLKIGKKIIVNANSYKINQTKKSTFIITENPKWKIEIDEDLIPLIDQNSPIILEFTKASKTILFISNNNKNLLEELYNKE